MSTLDGSLRLPPAPQGNRPAQMRGPGPPAPVGHSGVGAHLLRVRPSKEQWALLTRIERANFAIVDALNRNAVFRWLLSWPRWLLGTAWVEFVTSRLCKDSGFEHFETLDPSRGVLLVANHRSFFDLFVISARLYRKFGNHRTIVFPVRSSFFYSSPFGLSVNLPVAQAAMYPPIFREKEKRDFNRFSMDLLVELLGDPEYLVGFHPEGTRNKGPDPYALLPGKPGCGELIHRGRPNVVPVFLQGFPRFAWFGAIENRLPARFRPTWVHMVMGAPMDFSEEYALEGSPETYQRIADKVMAELTALGQLEKSYRQRAQDDVQRAREAR